MEKWYVNSNTERGRFPMHTSKKQIGVSTKNPRFWKSKICSEFSNFLSKRPWDFLCLDLICLWSTAYSTDVRYQEQSNRGHCVAMPYISKLWKIERCLPQNGRLKVRIDRWILRYISQWSGSSVTKSSACVNVRLLPSGCPAHVFRIKSARTW